MHRAKLVLIAIALLCLALPLGAADLPCRPCAGLRLYPAPAAPAEPEPGAPAPLPSASPADVAGTLKASGGLEPGSPFFVAWEAPLSGEAAADAGLPATVRDSGATPWVSLVFRTPPPLAQSADRLQGELRAAASLAGKAPVGTWFQVVWRPESGDFTPAEYAFLLKRAAVALTGAQTEAKVATGPLPTDPQVLKAFYDQEVVAYVEAVTLQPAGEEALS